MPNIKSAKKRVLVTKKETVLNNDVKASMKTAIKRIDNAASKGVIKANTRDRYKTRVQKIVNSK